MLRTRDEEAMRNLLGADRQTYGRNMSTQRHPRKIAAAIGGVVLAAGTVTGVAFAASGTDDTTDRTETEKAIPADDLDRAEAVALAETGGGTVTGTEVDDEESKYEVEVTLDDGSQVDVQLDENFTVVGTEADGQPDTEDEG
jgi:uncharacterized membrane protein YkoI